MKIKISIFIFLFTTLLVAQTSNYYQDSIKLEIQKIVSDSLRAQKYYEASNYALMMLNDFKLCRKYHDSSVYYSKESNYKKYIAMNHFLYGRLNRYEGNYDTALTYFNKCIEYTKMGLIKEGHALFNIGAIYSLKGDYDKSLKTYVDILAIFEKKKDTVAIATTLNAIAVVYGSSNKDDKAIEYFIEANEYFIKLNKKRDIALTHNNIGEMLIRKGDTSKARENILKALSISNDISIDYTKARSLYNLGRTYLLSDSNKALDYYFQAKEILKKNNYNNLLIKVYRDIGHLYKDLKKDNKAILYYNKALVLSEKLDELPSKEEIFEGLSEIYKTKNQFKEAYNYLSEYIIVKDSLFNIENTRELNLLQTQFDTQKKDKEIIQQQLQLEKIENELQKKKTQTNYLAGIAIFLLVASILVWFLFQQRQKRKNQEIITLKREHQIKTLETLIEGEEKERFRIAKELHDGVNGDLSAIKFKLTTLLEMNNTVIKEAITMIDKSCSQVRAISHNLVPPSLENFNLLEAVEEYCEKSDTSHSEKITFQHLGDAINISKKEEINIFRIIQELVTNSIKHAQATEINVQISCRNKIIQITVEDNGKGFDNDKAKTKGIGLKNIQSRVDYLNGTIDLISNKQGTSTTIEIDRNINDNN